MPYFAAVDLGATSGRVAVGLVTPHSISFEIIHRFPNELIKDSNGSLLWDLANLFTEVKKGLIAAASKHELISVAVDSWAVDYLLFDERGIQTAPSYSYRDFRTDGIMSEIIAKFGKETVYKNTGVQFLPFNTMYQLLAAQRAGQLTAQCEFLMLPDVINKYLVGSDSNEITNASSTQLLNTRTREWDWPLIQKVGLPATIFPRLHEAETYLGEISEVPQLAGIKVVSVGSHDTASAVAATPMTDSENSIYISSGTWSLVGCEINSPITSSEALGANLTNELGVGGKVRLLKNVAGMWIISELLREWNEAGNSITITDLVTEAAGAHSLSRIDPNDPTFIHPGKMQFRIEQYCERNSIPAPITRGEIVRCVYESLADSYSRTLQDIEKVTEKKFSVVNIVGGGSANDFLNQLTANATRLKVIAGPIEATLLGNVGVQAIAAGIVQDLTQLRALIVKSEVLRTFYPDTAPD